MTYLRTSMPALRSLAIGVLVVFSFGAAGEICGGFFETTVATFGSKFPDNKPRDIQTVLSTLSKNKPQRHSESSLAFLVVEENPRAIVAWDLANNRQLWKISPPINSEITVGDDAIVFLSGTDVVAYGIKDGQRLWELQVDEGWTYLGADLEGGLAVVSLGTGSGQVGAYANGTIIGVESPSGKIQWEFMSGGGLLGEPAVYGGLVFIPWDRQKIVVIDPGEKEEICRIRADDFTIDFLQKGPSGIYYGSSSASGKTVGALLRLDKSSANGTLEGSTVYMPVLDPVPGAPAFKRDAFARPIAGHSAMEKIRFHWKPEPASSEPIPMAGNTFFLHYWRYIIAFEQDSSQVRWIYRSPNDVESMAALSGGILGVSSGGRVFFVDAKTGQETWQQETGQKVLTAAFDADGFQPPAPGGASAQDPLVHLKEMIWDKDNRMLPIRSYAALLMAMIPSPEVTRDLLQIYSDALIPKGLREAIVKGLEKRTTGSEYLVEALDMHYDYLEQTRAPPMDVVSTALANMNEKSAVPGLLDHLTDHETPVGHIKSIALAIRDLGDASAVDTLRRFLILYHADSSFVGNEDALAAVAEAILGIQGKEGEKLVTKMRADTTTLPELRVQLAVLMADSDETARAELEAAEAARREAEARAKAEAEARAKAEAAAAAGPPVSLERSQINQVIADSRDAIKPCVQDALREVPTLTNIRLRFEILGETGKVSKIQVLPNNVKGLLECLQQSFETIEFPRFKNPRQMATYSINIK